LQRCVTIESPCDIFASAISAIVINRINCSSSYSGFAQGSLFRFLISLLAGSPYDNWEARFDSVVTAIVFRLCPFRRCRLARVARKPLSSPFSLPLGTFFASHSRFTYRPGNEISRPVLNLVTVMYCSSSHGSSWGND